MGRFYVLEGQADGVVVYVCVVSADFPWDGLRSDGFIFMIDVLSAMFVLHTGGWAGVFYVHASVPCY